MDAKNDSMVNVITKSGRIICGRYAGERKGNIQIVQQRIVIPDDKLLGKGVHDIAFMRCSKDTGDLIDIPISDFKTWSYARYLEMRYIAELEKKDYFWSFFHC